MSALPQVQFEDLNSCETLEDYTELFCLFFVKLFYSVETETKKKTLTNLAHSISLIYPSNI